ncbi:hypothetical protein TH8_08460 [Thalassospira profundimaris]|nr:hypothetical protein TH8_08460 [Thalassospira profundimaris]
MKPSIVMVNLTRISSGEGGAMHQIAIARQLMRQSYKVTLIAPGLESDPSLPEDIAGIADPITDLARYGLPRSLNIVLQLPKIFIARMQGYSVLYIRQNLTALLGVLLARSLKMKVVCEHNGWSSSERRLRSKNRCFIEIEKFSQILSAKMSHRNRVVTDGLRELLEHNGVPPHKIYCIGNGCDTETFKPSQSNPRPLPNTKITIGFIGGLVAWQGVETAINAFSIIRRRKLSDKDLALIVAGDGPQKKMLEELTTSLQLDDHIKFLGYVPRDQAANTINTFDIAIAPFTRRRNSEIGLSPIKIRDYAACGKPVLASDITGISELSRYGWLTTHAPDSPEDMANKLVMLINNPTALMEAQQKARQFAVEHFDWNVIGKDVNAIISSL